jgi:ferredoxin-NADP reductase
MDRYKLKITDLKVANQYVTITFEKPTGLIFQDGQYGVFLHVGKDFEGRKMRAFNFASSMKEKELIVCTRLSNNNSPFKQVLLDLKPGDFMTVDGPMGNFLKKPKSTKDVFIAGEVGITPIRSILMGMSSYNNAELIYSEFNNKHPFINELKNLDGLEINLSDSRSRTLYLVEQTARINQNSAVYYVSGVPSFVVDIIGQLEVSGIVSDKIIIQRMTGY